MGFRLSEVIFNTVAETGWNYAKYILQEYNVEELIYALQNMSYVEAKKEYDSTIIEEIIKKRKEQNND